MLETARDLTLEAARDASFARKPSNRPLPPVQLKKLLDSRRDAEVLDGLRRVISVYPLSKVSQLLARSNTRIRCPTAINPHSNISPTLSRT
jgi:hypothetical protein